MLEAETRSWTGTRLLEHLIYRLRSDSPHLPLNLYTLYSLIASRPSLLAGHQTARSKLAEALAVLASVDTLTRTGRDHLAGLMYALRMRSRRNRP